MSNPAIFFDDWENKPLVIPVSNCAEMQLNISTRNYNAVVVWGDNTKSYYGTLKNTDASAINFVGIYKAFSPKFTGDIKVYFKGGLKDVYSYNFKSGNIDTDFYQKYNIQNLGLFLAQMPNLYSYFFNFYAYGVIDRQSTIIGDFAQNPDSVERILIRAIDVKDRATALVLNFNNFKNTSKLKWFRKESGPGSAVHNALRFLGDIAKIPPLCTHFYIQEGVNILTATSAITYTNGKVWESSFDTLQIPLALTTPELDNLLIDMDNSINTKIGDGIIYLDGYRSSTSDSAVASLQAKGFTVNIKRQLGLSILDSSVIFRADFQNNFDVYSNSYIGAIAGGTSNQPTFALSGRKPGEYCAVFNGSQSIKTTTNLPVNSDKVTIAFWIKTTQTETSVVTELGIKNTENRFGFILNNVGFKNSLTDGNGSGVNNIVGNNTATSSWTHVTAVIDRSLGVSQSKIYFNGILNSTQNATYFDDLVGNWTNSIMHIGQRGGSTLGFKGSLTKLKIYNYPFTPTEVSNLYNSEL